VKRYLRAFLIGTTATGLGLTTAGCRSNDALTTGTPASTHVAKVTMEFHWPPGSGSRAESGPSGYGSRSDGGPPLLAAATPAAKYASAVCTERPAAPLMSEGTPSCPASARTVAGVPATLPEAPPGRQTEAKSAESSPVADALQPKSSPDPLANTSAAAAAEPVKRAEPIVATSTPSAQTASGNVRVANVPEMTLPPAQPSSMKQSLEPASVANATKTMVVPGEPASVANATKTMVVPEEPAQVRSADAPPAKRVTDEAVAAGGPAFHVVNSKRIKLHFEIKDAGPAGIAGVELWYMHENREWKKPDAPLQKQGPFVLEVDGEGLYGFKLIARNSQGRGDAPPRAGDTPQVWVLVDLTKPAVRINSARLLLEAEGGKLELSWIATDKNLAGRPVTVLYAEQPNGPWLPLIANLESSGMLLKKLPASMPKRFLVRVEAIDIAGNLGADQTHEFLGVEQPPTQVSILKID
jgi:hypothetical protein